MKSFNDTIGFWLALVSISLAEPNPPAEGAPRNDGMINIGGVLYPEDEMKDPETRRKVELAAKRIEQMREIEKLPRDYSRISTADLFRSVLVSMRNVHYQADLQELSERPEETREAVEEFLQNEKPFNDITLLFSRVPAIAGTLGSDYEVEVTKRIIEHPLAKKYDQALLFDGMISGLANGSLLDHLSSSGKNETETLDKLIGEGRLEKGSDFELKWRKLLSGGIVRSQAF